MVTISPHQFHWSDSFVCILMLLVSIGIGIYYGFYHVSKNTQDYLMGGRNMPLLPVAVSLISSYISGVSIMGIPTETYTYGTQFLYVIAGTVSAAIVLNYIFLPVFYNLQIISVFEYLEKRFDAKLRFLGTFLFTISMLTWLPIVTYVPALAINQITGVNIYTISTIICIICIFYTSLGGIKAVVWTDVIQGFSMLGAIFIVVIKGTYDNEGFSSVWERNMNSTRIEPPNFSLNPLTRHTFWALTVGGCLQLMLTGGIHQTMFQRYMSLPSYKTVQKALLIYICGINLVFLVVGYCGLLMYATYHDCDPWLTGIVQKKEQVLIVFVMKVINNYPGLLGVFVAGILSATLSTLSTGCNSMAAVVVRDFYSFISSKPLTERQSSIIMKLTITITGVGCVLLIFVVEKLGTILQVAMTLNTVSNGPALGIFIIGVLLPWIKSKGALVGGITSLLCMIWYTYCAQAAIASGELVFEEKPLHTDGCLYDFSPRNLTTMQRNSSSIYHISYLWYTPIGTVITIIAGFLGSLMLESLNPLETDLQLLSPCIRRFFKTTHSKPYEDVHYELNQMDTNEEKA